MRAGPPRGNPEFMRDAGQASLEMTLAWIGVLLLLFGSFKVFLWVNKRMIARQQAYESSRVAAGSSTKAGAVEWDEPSEKLAIFK